MQEDTLDVTPRSLYAYVQYTYYTYVIPLCYTLRAAE